MLKEASYYARMTRGLVDVLKPRRAQDPKGKLRRQFERREEDFVQQVRDLVFAMPEHPYRKMFALAGCEFGDFEDSIRRLGLEKTLRQLKDAGVYLAHDELKGKRPMVRGGKEIPGNADSFLKPGQGGYWTSQSGGSRSSGTATPHGVAYRAHRNCYVDVWAEEFGLGGCGCVMLLPILPASYAFACARSAQLAGAPVSHWFAVGGGLRDAGPYRWVTRALVTEAKLLGCAIPWPALLPANDFMPVVRCLEKAVSKGRKTLVWSVVSPAVRVAAAALEHGISLHGVQFLVGGEALTAARREVIEQSGAEVCSTYYASELGTIGYGCRRMKSNCVHLFEDNVTAIAVERPAPLTDVLVQSLHFTTLLPYNPRLLINVEMDDHGILGTASCDCSFTQVGYSRQIDDIWSFSKLTGYGATLVGSDILRLLERALPRQFGGSPADYQLVETEREGIGKLILRVSPRTGARDTAAVREFFLKEVRGLFGGSLTVRDWKHAEAFTVTLEEPVATKAGKVLALHLLGTGTRSKAGSARA
ncbi:MAG TPA: hypothetical protein VHW09_23180 [Bryobacteraceae bacterium]|jgi:hypothetical protein|nr:hypothetical protein [Bryobacteraceae bacterium]